MCSCQLATGPLPVVSAWMYMPSMDTMARRPFFSSFSWSSDSVVGSHLSLGGRRRRRGR